MNYLNSKKKKIFLILYISLLVFSSLGSINTFYKSESNDPLTSNDEMEFNLNDVQFDLKSLPKWMEQNSKADKNENGIDDNFEARLNHLSEFGFIEENFDKDKEDLGRNYIYDDIFKTDNQKTERITIEDIPIIISFPNGDYDSISLLFETLGGKIKSTYKAALNGFAGRISYNSLNEFCDLLVQNDIPFFIEEDKICTAQLYYAGRNMNLRPYVWDTLSYDGDEYSSIAIIDTGIDNSHDFFPLGYSDADFDYKIVGWRDEVNELNDSPYDDNGHGSHCSGISAGEGGPNYDGTGRTVATAAYEFDYTGANLPEQSVLFNWARFNVTDPGLIELFCEFDDFTPGSDEVDFYAYLYYGETIVASYEVDTDSWSHTLSYTATSSDLGLYSFRFYMDLIDNTGDNSVSDFNIRFRSEMHWPFSPNLFGSGDAWKGVAPDAHLVGVKVLDEHGSGSSSDLIDGINWVITNKNVYNITTMSLSLGFPSSVLSVITAVNNAVEEGIVTVVSAGNSGPGGNNIGSPGDADNVITVAAMNVYDEITDYSSQGGLSYTGNTVKPDITAPGGSFYNVQMFSTDTNDNDAEGGYPTDGYANDMMGAQGTSMATPAVAGAANLLIEAMGGHQSWGYTGTEAKRVKALLLMSATETYPLLRETDSGTYSPGLNRGGKDVHEGYGRLNVDVAIEAYTQELALGSTQNAWIVSSFDNPFNKHGLGCYVNLNDGKSYNFTLDVPVGADFDLHLYSNNPSSIGEPIMVASSTSSGLGTDEIIIYTATETGKYYLVAKAISGEGDAIISNSIITNDLSVSLEVPTKPEIDQTYIINATVTNTGSNIATNVDLFLYIDSVLVNSTTVSTLSADASDTINCVWIPTEYKTYNFTAYAPPVPDEPYIKNNVVTELISIIETKLFDGMYIDHIYTESGSSYPSSFSYSYYSGSLFFETWDIWGSSFTWYVDSQTRLMSGGSVFGDGTHTPAWIFTNVSLGDEIFIASDGDGDHRFSVADELIYYLPGFGLLEVWELEDLDLPGGVAWYEKSTGILLNGTFYYGGGANWYTFDFIDTNVEFTYAVLLDDFELSSNAGTPDKDGSFDLTWESAEDALNYSVYEYSSDITEINGSLTLLVDGTEDLSLSLSGYLDGTYYFIVVAHNDRGDTLSNCIEVVVELGPPPDFILSSNAGTPDKDGVFKLTWTIAYEAHNYSVYEYSSYITEINGSLTPLIAETTDLTLPLSSYANGTYYFIAVANNTYGGTLSNCIEIVVELGPPADFILSSNAGTPDDNGAFDLTWESTEAGQNYSIYQYSSYISEINGDLTLLIAETTDLSLALSGYTDGTYYFIAVAHNAYGDTLSNCIEVVVGVPPGDFILSSNAGTPDDNGNFDLTWGNSSGALNYSIYQYSSYISEINGDLTLLGDGITDLSLALSGYTDGTYYFIAVAHNAYNDTLSNCIEVVVQIPGDLGIPPYIIFAAIGIILVIGIVIVIIIIKRRK